MIRPALVALLLAALGAGCSTVRPWINAPLRDDGARADVAAIAKRDPSALVAITLSGGGARAAAFGFGVLQELRATPCCWNDRSSNLLNAVDLISGVSGGSIVAAFYAAFGSEGLDNFERDFLRRNFQDGLLSQTVRPGNLYDLTSPWFGRSQLLERRLAELYDGLTYGDIARRPRHPELIVTATDISTGTGFEFTADQFALICSDIDSVPLSFAVAASSAVPLLLSPVTLRNYSAECPVAKPALPQDLSFADDYRARLLRSQERIYADARAHPYVHLLDGGVSDNLGIRRMLDRALSSGLIGSVFSEVRIPPGSIRRLVIIVVNAGRDPSKRIDQSDKVPSTADVVDALLFGTGNHATDETQEFVSDVAKRLQDDLRAGRRDRFPGLASGAEVFLIQVNLRDSPEADERAFLLQVPTAFSVSQDETTRLIAAGRDVVRASPEFQRLRKSLGLSSLP